MSAVARYRDSMRVAALCDPSDDSFIVSVLREAGHAVRVLEAGDPVDDIDADVLVARVVLLPRASPPARRPAASTWRGPRPDRPRGPASSRGRRRIHARLEAGAIPGD